MNIIIRTKTGNRPITLESAQGLSRSGKLPPTARVMSADDGATWLTFQELEGKLIDSGEVDALDLHIPDPVIPKKLSPSFPGQGGMVSSWRPWMVLIGALLAVNYVVPLASWSEGISISIFTWSFFSEGMFSNGMLATCLLLLSLNGMTMGILAFIFDGLGLAITSASTGLLGIVLTILLLNSMPMVRYIPNFPIVSMLVVTFLMTISSSSILAWDSLRQRLPHDALPRFSTLGSSVVSIVLTIVLLIMTLNLDAIHDMSGGVTACFVCLVISALIPVAGSILMIIESGRSRYQKPSLVGRHLITWGIAAMGILTASLVWAGLSGHDGSMGFWIGQTTLRLFAIMAASALLFGYGMVGIVITTVYRTSRDSSLKVTSNQAVHSDVVTPELDEDSSAPVLARSSSVNPVPAARQRRPWDPQLIKKTLIYARYTAIGLIIIGIFSGCILFQKHIQVSRKVADLKVQINTMAMDINDRLVPSERPNDNTVLTDWATAFNYIREDKLFTSATGRDGTVAIKGEWWDPSDAHVLLVKLVSSQGVSAGTRTEVRGMDDRIINIFRLQNGLDPVALQPWQPSPVVSVQNQKAEESAVVVRNVVKADDPRLNATAPRQYQPDGLSAPVPSVAAQPEVVPSRQAPVQAALADIGAPAPTPTQASETVPPSDSPSPAATNLTVQPVNDDPKLKEVTDLKVTINQAVVDIMSNILPNEENKDNRLIVQSWRSVQSDLKSKDYYHVSSPPGADPIKIRGGLYGQLARMNNFIMSPQMHKAIQAVLANILSLAKLEK